MHHKQQFRAIIHILPEVKGNIVGNKARRISNTHTCVSEGKKCLFFGNFGMLCFLETAILRFALLPYYLIPKTYT